ncbi:hypothetical protein [Sporichthya brevicatena]|uniref:hypothetical protein n=1 Tax=Sporichthya brevicatena TaxID=171442 RepID=UPI0031CE2B51
MRRLTHPLTGATYEWAEDGVGPVKVTDRQGVVGRFDRDGVRVAGELVPVDPEMCRWIVSGGPVAGGAAARSRRFAAPAAGESAGDPVPQTASHGAQP